MPKVVVLATGGTVAGAGEPGKSLGYAAGQVRAQDLLLAVPGLSALADIDVVDVCALDSCDMSARVWLELAEVINARAADPSVSGFVVLHGTDTLEETAFFLHLTVKTIKPVVLTGAMHPPTALSPDGPGNVFAAVAVAAAPAAAGRGVMVVFADQIYSARFVTKAHTSSLDAFSSAGQGSMGTVLDGEAVFAWRPEQPHTVRAEFDVTGCAALPTVCIVQYAVDADPALLAWALEHADGVVIAGAGMGGFGKEWASVLAQTSTPVVVASRAGSGLVVPRSLRVSHTVAAYDLQPAKAAVLLRLALAAGISRAILPEVFARY